MPMSSFVPLTEAAAFTFGCAILRTQRFDPERVSIVLVCVATLLVAGLLISLTPGDVCIDTGALDPAAVWPIAVDADP